MTLLEPDRDQLEIFVEALFRHVGKDGWLSMRAFYENDSSPIAARITPTSLAGGLPFVVDVAEDDARRAANHPKAQVFCPPVAVFSNKDHAREDDLLLGPALAVECDQRPREARAKLEQLLGPATVIVRSGGQWTDPSTGEIQDRVHLYWRLSKSAKGKDDLNKLKQARMLTTHLVGGDSSNIPICHPIRWPGSWHRKGEPRPCEIVELHPDCEIDLDKALAVLTAAAPTPPPSSAPTDQGQFKGEALDWSDSFGKIITGKEFHPVLVPLASSFAAQGIPELATRHALRALLDNTQTTDTDRLRRRDVELGKLRDTVHSGYKKFAAATPADTLFDPWVEMKLPDFPLETLPETIRVFVDSQSAVIGGCPNAMALATLCALSGAIDHRFKVKMMEHGTWRERPRLWGLLVGDPSKKKTPIINAATRPLERYQHEVIRDYKARLRAHLRAGGKAGDENAPEKPPYYIIFDTTIEACGEILERSPGGVLVKRDEIVGWIDSMERYAGTGRASDRAFWLQAYDGGYYTFHRIKRGEVSIPNLSASILGGVQPNRLAELHELTSDGLLQRFIPVIIRTAGLPLDVENDTRPYTELVYKLLATPPQRFTFTEEALRRARALRQHLHELEQACAGVADGFQSFIGKLGGYVGSLALILHVTEYVDKLPSFVAGKTLERVDQIIVNFIIPHATEFYRLGGSGDRLKRLASFILTSDLDCFRAADLTANVRDLRGKSLVELNERLSPLVAGGWLDPADKTPVCRVWTINPAVRIRFADRHRVETVRKQNIVAMLRERRKAKGGSDDD